MKVGRCDDVGGGRKSVDAAPGLHGIIVVFPSKNGARIREPCWAWA